MQFQLDTQLVAHQRAIPTPRRPKTHQHTCLPSTFNQPQPQPSQHLITNINLTHFSPASQTHATTLHSNLPTKRATMSRTTDKPAEMFLLLLPIRKRARFPASQQQRQPLIPRCARIDKAAAAGAEGSSSSQRRELCTELMRPRLSQRKRNPLYLPPDARFFPWRKKERF